MSFEQPDNREVNKEKKETGKLVEDVEEILSQNPAIQKRQQEHIEKLVEDMEIDREREDLEESLFEYVVLASLQDIFEEGLESAGFSQEEIDAIRDAFIKMSDDELLKVFSTQAYENKEKMLNYCKGQIEKGKIDVADLPQFLLEKAEDLGFGVGFHASNEEINPDSETKKWDIQGTEKDHRFEDQDVPMAYYSTDYEHIYREGAPDYLYMVRSRQEGEGTGHRRAGESWGMAPTLSVIARLDMDEVDDFIQRRVEEYQEEDESGEIRKAA